jgi:succinyl-CoA synthetase beta subunit
VTNDITVRRGNLVKASVNIKAEVYQNISIDSKVSEILEEYAYQFGVDLESKKSEIIALLSKIPNVKQITSLEITYTNELADVIPWETVQESLETTYFSITYLVNSIIYTS